jgi:predicted TIM-barrel fold metal-dependent hydrolase
MDRIIDAHCHLGDILNRDGGFLIEKTGVRKRILFDPVTISELGLHRSYGLDDLLFRLLSYWVTRAEQARNATATRENLRKSMDESGVIFSTCMPLPPHVTFEDLRDAAAEDPGIIPFTGIDFTREYDIDSALARDVKSGAKGLKLHPIIQNVSLDSPRTFAAVEAFAPHGLPVMLHTGVMSYYLGQEKDRENPLNGEIRYARELVRAFPKVNFIAGHAGLYEVRDVMDMLGGFHNVWVDISFQSPEKIRKLIKVFGPERVLYGSDWPWGNRNTPQKTVRKACRGDKGLERRIFRENAAELMSLNL